MSDVLVLNAGYIPLGTTTWQKALTWVVTGHAEVMEEYDDWEVHSAFQTFQVPSVIRLVKTVAAYFKRGVKFNRKNVWTRDKGTCFPAGTRILMSDGSQRDISKVRVGDSVIDALGFPQTVLMTGTRVSPVLTLRHRGSALGTQVTPEHPFLTPGGTWVPIQESPKYLLFPREVHFIRDEAQDFDAAAFLSRGRWMRVKDGRVFTSRRPHEVGVPTRLEVSAEHAYVLGLFAAEGNCTGGQKITFAFHIKERNTLAADVTRFYTRLGFHPTVEEYPKNNRCVVKVCSKGIAEILLHFCGSKEGKRTPWELLGPYHKDYLRGLFSGDASFNHELKRIALHLIADDLVFQAQSMLWGLGIYPTVQIVRRQQRKDAWGLVLNAKNYSTFMKTVMGVVETPEGEPIYGDENFVFRKLQSLVLEDTPVEVFNLEVGRSHSYIANGLAVHNCQYCGKKVNQSEFQFEHVIPRKLGGETTWENIVVACHPCNQKKRDRTPEQAGMKLLSKPVRPKSLAGVPLTHGLHIDQQTAPACWRDYLGSFIYWNEPLND